MYQGPRQEFEDVREEHGRRRTNWGTIDAQAIVFPAEARDLNAAIMHFTVPSSVARALLADEPFEIVEVAPGATLLLVVAIEFRVHSWGAFNVVSVGLWARPRGAPEAPCGPFLYRSPVNQRFSCEVGYRAQAVTTTVEQIDVRYGDDDVTFALAVDSQPTLALSIQRVPPREAPKRATSWVYSSLNGVPYGARVELTMGTGAVDPASVGVELGTSPLALDLRRLGLPKAPGACTWGEGLTATYHMAQPVGRSPVQTPDAGDIAVAPTGGNGSTPAN